LPSQRCTLIQLTENFTCALQLFFCSSFSKYAKLYIRFHRVELRFSNKYIFKLILNNMCLISIAYFNFCLAHKEKEQNAKKLFSKFWNFNFYIVFSFWEREKNLFNTDQLSNSNKKNIKKIDSFFSSKLNISSAKFTHRLLRHPHHHHHHRRPLWATR
jgi:hypothetical protein